MIKTISIVEKNNYQKSNYIDEINFEKKIIIFLPETSQLKFFFNFNGSISFVSGEEIPISTIKNTLKILDERKIKKHLDVIVSVPANLYPLVHKPLKNPLVSSCEVQFDEYINVNHTRLQENISPTNLIYYNWWVTFNIYKEKTLKQYPSLILPNNFILFDLIFLKTCFTSIEQIPEEIIVFRDNQLYTGTYQKIHENNGI